MSDATTVEVFVGQGVTWYWADDIYAGTVTRVADNGSALWFKQDRPVKTRGTLDAAFLFVGGRGLEEYEARLREDGRYVLVTNGRPIDIGVRRWATKPITMDKRET